METREMTPEEEKKEINELKKLDEEADLAGASTSEAPEPPEEPQLIYQFGKPYIFEGNTYEDINLNGITRFTTRDMEYFDRALTRVGHSPQNKWFDTTYMKLIATRATGFPIDFFNTMPMKEFIEIEARIRAYFLFM